MFLLFLVLVIGLEPIRLLHRGILSPLRLPIPPHQRWRRHPDLNRGIKVLQTLALPLGYSALLFALSKKINSAVELYGAGNEIRTRDIHLGKVTLYH